MTENHEQQAATLGDGIPSTVELLGNIMKAFADHSLMLESQAKGLSDQSAMQLRSMRSADQYIGELQANQGELKEQVALQRSLLQQGFAILGAAFSRGSQPVTVEIMEAIAQWAERFQAMFPEWPHGLTDGLPLPGSDDEEAETFRKEWYAKNLDPAKEAAPVATEPGCQHPDCVLAHPHSGPAILAQCKCPRQEDGSLLCEHAPDGRIHPAAPSAGPISRVYNPDDGR